MAQTATLYDFINLGNGQIRATARVLAWRAVHAVEALDTLANSLFLWQQFCGEFLHSGRHFLDSGGHRGAENDRNRRTTRTTLYGGE